MANLSGYNESEYTGDSYFPSLVGISRLKSKESLTSLKAFKYNHKYSNDFNLMDSDTDDYIILQSDLDELYNLFTKIDLITKSEQDNRTSEFPASFR